MITYQWLRHLGTWILAGTLFAASVGAQPGRNKPAAKPGPSKPKQMSVEVLKKSLLPRTLTVTISVTGGDAYPIDKTTTTEWKVDRKYSATTILGAIADTCDIRTCGSATWTSRYEGAPKSIGWDVAVNDSLVEVETYRAPTKEESYRTKTTTTTFKCYGPMDTLNLVDFVVNIQDADTGLATASTGITAGIGMGPGNCVYQKIVRGSWDKDPPDFWQSSLAFPSNSWPESVSGFKAPNFLGIEFPILARTIAEAGGKSITFSTGEYEAALPEQISPRGEPPRPQVVKVSAVYTFK